MFWAPRLESGGLKSPPPQFYCHNIISKLTLVLSLYEKAEFFTLVIRLQGLVDLDLSCEGIH